SYDADSVPVLNHINLKIPAGTKCGIIGETGSGKSSLVHLILRLFEPPDGTVFIDGVDVKQIPLRRLQDDIGFVSQDIFLFSGTVRENILLGAENGGQANGEAAGPLAQMLPAIRGVRPPFQNGNGQPRGPPPRPPNPPA